MIGIFQTIELRGTEPSLSYGESCPDFDHSLSYRRPSSKWTHRTLIWFHRTTILRCLLFSALLCTTLRYVAMLGTVTASWRSLLLRASTESLWALALHSAKGFHSNCEWLEQVYTIFITYKLHAYYFLQFFLDMLSVALQLFAYRPCAFLVSSISWKRYKRSYLFGQHFNNTLQFVLVPGEHVVFQETI